VGPFLGAARGALPAAAHDLARRRAGGPGHRVLHGHDVGTELAIARALARTEAAGALLTRGATEADGGAGTTGADTARLALQYAASAELLTDAVDAVFRLVGTSSHDQGAPLQRFWRDMATAAGHAVLRIEPAARDYIGTLDGAQEERS
jgi:two-component flavin-dependent monooxygenase